MKQSDISENVSTLIFGRSSLRCGMRINLGCWQSSENALWRKGLERIVSRSEKAMMESSGTLHLCHF